MKFEMPSPVGRVDAARIIAGTDVHAICKTLVAVSLGESDWRWAQEHCLTLSRHADWSVRAIAATCLGHLARIHGQLDLSRVLPQLDALLADPRTSGYAENAMGDIRMFIGMARF